MDQNYFSGVGNIYRAEILFKSGIHPACPGQSLSREQFDRVWYHCVKLLQRGFQCGSILTVDKDEAKRLGKPGLRRYIYNNRQCPRCQTAIQIISMAARKCYLCPTCQEQPATGVEAKMSDVSLFQSHCVYESLAERRHTPEKLKVAELRQALLSLGLETGDRKQELVQRLKEADRVRVGLQGITSFRSSAGAAADKAAVGEGRNVEHVADLDLTAKGRTVDWLDLEGDAQQLALPSTPVKRPNTTKRRVRSGARRRLT